MGVVVLLRMSVVPENLDMGIWSDDNTLVWLPKAIYPSRNDAKRFAVQELEHTWIEVRVRTVWMCPDEDFMREGRYVKCLPDLNPDAIECWEIR